MVYFRRRLANTFPVVILASTLVFSPSVLAQEVVKTSDLHQALLSASQTRQENLKNVETFLSSPPVKDALKKARIDSAKVKRVIPLISNEELARLAAQTQKAQKDLAMGALSNQELTYIVIALAAAVVVLIAVAA